jgi:hypothetical protein
MAEALSPLCAGRNHPIEKKVLSHVLTRKYGTGMALGFIAKDVKIARDMPHTIEACAPLADKVPELWSAAASTLGGQGRPDGDRPGVGRRDGRKAGALAAVASVRACPYANGCSEAVAPLPASRLKGREIRISSS